MKTYYLYAIIFPVTERARVFGVLLQAFLKLYRGYMVDISSIANDIESHSTGEQSTPIY